MVLNYMSKIYLKLAFPDTIHSKSLSYKLMLANNLIASTDKGFFAILPIGQRIIDKLVKVIESELASIGAQKMEVPILGGKPLWSKSNRWDTMTSEMFKLIDHSQHHYCLQPTAEEMFTDLVEKHGLLKTTQLPLLIYQTSQKFRDELCPRFGLLRGRQFLMNDLYSFDADELGANNTYKIVNDIYERIFRQRLRLKNLIIVEADSGEMGGKLSHEYQLPNNSAEDKVLICQKCRAAHKFEIELPNITECKACKSSDLVIIDTIEVGHTFQLGDKYSKTFDALTMDKIPYHMCCFGIGVSRLIAASIDVLSVSENAMRLPIEITPFKLAVILSDSHQPHTLFANSFIKELDQCSSLQNEILVDDRANKSVGRKLIEINQLGVPHILVAGKRYTDFTENPKLEYFRNLRGIFYKLTFVFKFPASN